MNGSKKEIHTDGEVLVIGHGLTRAKTERDDNLLIHHRGILDIEKRYSAVILNWDGYACIGKLGEKFLVSDDIKVVIRKVKNRMKLLGSEDVGDSTMVINSSVKIPHITHTKNIHDATFLARRILSGKIDSNERNVAIVRTQKILSRNFRQRIRTLTKNYPDIKCTAYSTEDFFRLIETGEKTFDQILLPHNHKHLYAIPESSLRENLLEDDEVGALARGIRKKKDRQKEKILLSYESELGDEGLKTVWEACAEKKTIRCGEIINTDRGDFDEHLYRSIPLWCHSDLDIPSFLSKCSEL